MDCWISHQFIIGKTVITTFRCQNDMIEHLDIEQLRRQLDLLGQLFVHFTGLQLSRWVVMGLM